MAKYAVFSTWQDVPHLSDHDKAALTAAYLPHERDARTKGVPSLGAGAIYPVPEEDILCDPFEYPSYYRHVYALDVGWNRTACLWGAHDYETDTLYLYSEYYRSQAEPAVHAQAIHARGKWVPGVIDPAARGRSQKDGEQLLASYVALGLTLVVANNAVEAGIYEVWSRLSTGRIKVFRPLASLLSEYRIYRRDEKGKVVKENDHLLDCCFAPETLVWTDRGCFPIAELAGSEGAVVSRDGRVEKYVACRMTGKDKRLVTVLFDGGTSLRCTPDHRFLTPNGWVQAIDLKGFSCYNSVSDSIPSESPWNPSSSTETHRNSGAGATIAAGNISAEMATFCTALSGRLITAGLASLMDTMSIIKTTTHQIISHPTWNWCWLPSTYPSTTRAGRSHLPLKPWTPLPRGTTAMPGRSGTRGTTSEIPMRFMRAASSDACSAGDHILRASRGVINSVRMHARRAIGLYRRWMTSPASVSCVASSSSPTNTAPQKPAARVAMVRCLDVQDRGERSDVYCLSVPATECFAVGESGVIAHNCRYLVMSGIALAAPRPFEMTREARMSAQRTTGHKADYDPMAAAWSTGRR